MTDVCTLMNARTGHFLLESGHHGDLWLDLDGLFWFGSAVAPLVEELAVRLTPRTVDVVCGPLVGGALLAQLIASRLGVAFAYSERTTAGSGGLYSAEYRVPAVLAARLNGRRVAVVDDVVNAGSAVRATVRSVVAAGGRPVAVGALLMLGTTAGDAGLDVEALTTRPSTLWEPADCPLCASGLPVEQPGQG